MLSLPNADRYCSLVSKPAHLVHGFVKHKYWAFILQRLLFTLKIFFSLLEERVSTVLVCTSLAISDDDTYSLYPFLPFYK